MQHSSNQPEAERPRQKAPPRADDLRNLMIGDQTSPHPAAGEWTSSTASTSGPDWIEPDDKQIETSHEPWQSADESSVHLDIPSDEEEYQTSFNRGAEVEEGYVHGSSSDKLSDAREYEWDPPVDYSPDIGIPGPPAGFRRRLIAFLIDSLIIFTVLGLLFPMLLDRPFIDIDGINLYFDYVGELASTDPDVIDDEIPPAPERAVRAISDLQFSSIVNALLFSIYQAIMIGALGSSFGKRLLGIYILDRNGNVVGIPRSFARAVPMFASLLFFYFGFIFALFRPDRRTLHDLIADTYPVMSNPAQKATSR